MKTQAWGWLATAVLAAGFNSSYHSGGLEWAHRVADGVQHNTSVVLALATANAERFVAEAEWASAQNSHSCPFSAAVAAVRRSIAPVHSEPEGFEAMAARQEAALARLEANRVRMEARMERLNMANFNPVVVRVPRVVCPRLRMSVPRIPVVRMPATPMVHGEYPGAGPV